jgi:hypothetical protein
LMALNRRVGRVSNERGPAEESKHVHPVVN